MAITVQKGLAFPLRFGPLGHFERASGADKIRDDLKALVLTTAGERIMQPDFGTLGVRAVFRKLSPNFAGLMRTIIREAVAQHMPVVVVAKVDVTQDNEGGAITIGLTYRVRASSEFDDLEVLVEN